ncbi:MAG TPA: peptidylprolyl isomerase [Longimicrobiales bacterium]|nr:peptidylprolyl isomerase [Longimicrobiales bacterium]
MKNKSAWLAAALVAPLSACADDAAAPTLVARAGDYSLTVDQVVELLQDEESLPTQAAVVESLAELWIDYTLLADAVADDTTFSDLDFRAYVRQQVERDMVFQLRDSVIQVDTVISADELRELYAADSPEVEMRARHIMLTLPFEATAAQRDSVRASLEQIRERIVAGTPFEDVARQVSQDRGSAAAGGDLGFFSRGDLVRPFEDAVLALEPGELSEVVETPMGYHLIRLEERRAQDFEEIAPSFRQRVQADRTVAAESLFIAGLEGSSPPQLAEEALTVTRELARNPGTRLSRRAAGRPLVTWEGGVYEVGELQQLLQYEQPPMRDQVAAGTDEDLESFLRSLARRKMLVTEATRSGLEPNRARVDSLANVVRDQLLDAAQALGLTPLDQAPGEDRRLAIGRAVRRALADNIAGATRIVPLGLVGFQLREGVPITIHGNGVGTAILRIAEIRASRSPSPLEESVDTIGATGGSPAADTTGP